MPQGTAKDWRCSRCQVASTSAAHRARSTAAELNCPAPEVSVDEELELKPLRGFKGGRPIGDEVGPPKE
jgi:hypothetical protein